MICQTTQLLDVPKALLYRQNSQTVHIDVNGLSAGLCDSAWLKATAFFTVVFCSHDLIHQINATNPIIGTSALNNVHTGYRHCDCVSSLVRLENNLTSD